MRSRGSREVAMRFPATVRRASSMSITDSSVPLPQTRAGQSSARRSVPSPSPGPSEERLGALVEAKARRCVERRD